MAAAFAPSTNPVLEVGIMQLREQVGYQQQQVQQLAGFLGHRRELVHSNLPMAKKLPANLMRIVNERGF